MSCSQTALDPGGRPHRLPIVPLGIELRLRAKAWRHLASLIARWIARSEQRHDLANLNDHLLRDIGLTPGQAAREAAKPFWRE